MEKQPTVINLKCLTLQETYVVRHKKRDCLIKPEFINVY